MIHRAIRRCPCRRRPARRAAPGTPAARRTGPSRRTAPPPSRMMQQRAPEQRRAEERPRTDWAARSRSRAVAVQVSGSWTLRRIQSVKSAGSTPDDEQPAPALRRRASASPGSSAASDRGEDVAERPARLHDADGLVAECRRPRLADQHRPGRPFAAHADARAARARAAAAARSATSPRRASEREDQRSCPSARACGRSGRRRSRRAARRRRTSPA